VSDLRIVMDPPAADDEKGWIKWAQIALKFEGIDKALEVLGAYLALNPDRADELEANCTGPTRTGVSDADSRDGQP